MSDRPPVSGEPSTDYAGRWFFHAHGSECEPVCVLERIAKGTWEPVEARATPPSLDADAVIEGLIAVRERQHERGDDCYEQTESMKPWDREAWHTAYDYIEARDLRLTSKEERP